MTKKKAPSTSPKHKNMSYLTGWFLVEAKGDLKKAREMARNYLEEKSMSEKAYRP